MAWLDTVVRERGTQFRGLWDAWDHIRAWTFFEDAGTADPLDVDCTVGVGSLGCSVDSLTVEEISLDIIRDLIRVYDLHEGLAPSRAWGAVQLYFASTYPASTYPDCFTADSHPGSEILADTVMHLLVPEAELTYYDSTDCPSLPRTPSPDAERVVTDGMRGRVPSWYTTNITSGEKLWDAWVSSPSLPALANLADEFGGLCDTAWIEYPFVTLNFPPPAEAFEDDDNC